MTYPQRVDGTLEICVVGAGYVGLVTAACLATAGHSVRLIERDTQRIGELEAGRIPFHEPGLPEAVSLATSNGRLTFHREAAASHGAALVLICVGTLDASGNWTDAQVRDAVLEVARDADAPRTVVVRSTLLPGTSGALIDAVADADGTVELALNPEFTRQGTAMADFFAPDRLVFGLSRPAEDSQALPLLHATYAPVTGDRPVPVIVTDAQSAELIKAGSNAFLGIKVGFANELARLAAVTGADVKAVVDGIGLDPRIGRAFLTPGPGVGGSCIPSQARGVPAAARKLGVEMPIVAAIDRSNDAQAGWVAQQLEECLGELRGRRITLLGLAFKSGTDDVRDSPALAVARLLARRGATLAAHDPLAERAAADVLAAQGVAAAMLDDPLDACAGAAAVVVATDWPLYRALDWAAAAGVMDGRLVVDARGVVDLPAAHSAGLDVLVHGRRS